MLEYGKCICCKFQLIITQIMHRGFASDDEAEQPPRINFHELFKQTGFSAYRLLSNQSIIDDFKRDSQSLTRKLVENPQILTQMFDICLKPNLLTSSASQKINTNITHNAIQILSNMSEQFSEFLLSSSSKQGSIPDDFDDVITEEIFPMFKPNETFLYLFSILETQQVLDQTPVAYFSKIIVNLCYQKPKQMLEFFSNSATRNYTEKLFNHFYCRSLIDIVNRILEIEDSTTFYEHEKIGLLLLCEEDIAKQSRQQILVEKLENYGTLLEGLLEKIDDRFQKTKYASLMNQFAQEKTTIELLPSLYQQHASNQQIVIAILHIISRYLAFSSGNRQISTPVPRSPRNKLFEQNLDSSIQEIKLHPQLVSNIHKIMQDLKNSFASPTTDKFFALSYLHALKLLINVERELILKELIEVNFINKLFELGKQFPNNNTIHNFIKQIMIQCINHEYKQTTLLLLDENSCQFFNLASRITSNNSSFPFQNQIYHIFQTIIKKSQQNQQIQALSQRYCQFADILIKVKEKEEFYAYKAGGGLRKESSSWGDSSSQIIFDRFLSSGKKDEQKIVDKNPTDVIQGEQDHWFDCGGLPLDSDESLNNSNSCGNSHDLQLNSEDPKSPNLKESPEVLVSLLGEPKISNFLTSKLETSLEQELTFNKHFSSYLSYDVDSVLSELQ